MRERSAALEGFKNGRTRVLVATDIAARGIDVEGITHVFNFDLPHEPESYVHRIGRTGRAGNSGQAISFCDGEERPLLTDIERLIRRRINVLGHETTGFSAAPVPQLGPEADREPRPPGPPRNGRRSFGPSRRRR